MAYMDQMPYVAHIKENDYSAGSTFKIKAQVKWFDNPNPEYTVRVYSKQDLTLVNENGQSNMIHMDGQSPSGFTDSNYNGWREGGAIVSTDPVDVTDFVTLMNDYFQATASATTGFNGLTFIQANDLLEQGLEHFGLQAYASGSDYDRESQAQDADGDNLLFKTEFLLAAKSLANFVNGQLGQL